MKKNLYIHFGMHKTGSTSIQVALYRNEENLKKLGVLYPATGRPESARFGHHAIAWSFVGNKEWVPEIKGVREAINRDDILYTLIEEIESSNCNDIILSSEEFDILSDLELEDLFFFFRDFNVIPIVYIRNTVDFIESSYKTSVFYSGYSKSIGEFLQNQRSRLDTSSFVSKLFFLSEEKLILKNYDTLKETNNLISDFLGSVNVECSAIDYDESVKENKSPPSEILEVIRFLNAKKVEYSVVKRVIEKLMLLSKNHKVHMLPEREVEQLDSEYLESMKLITLLFESKSKPFTLSNKFAYRAGDIYLDDNLAKSILFVINSFDELISNK